MPLGEGGEHEHVGAPVDARELAMINARYELEPDAELRGRRAQALAAGAVTHEGEARLETWCELCGGRHERLEILLGRQAADVKDTDAARLGADIRRKADRVDTVGDQMNPGGIADTPLDVGPELGRGHDHRVGVSQALRFHVRPEAAAQPRAT